MRVLIVNGTDLTQIGGVNTAIRRVSAVLSKRGHTITVLSINPGALKDDELIDGTRVVRVRSSLIGHSMDASFKMWRYLDTNLGTHLNPEIVHVHGYNSLLAHEIAFLCHLKEIPFVYSPHYNPNAHTLPVAGFILRTINRLARLSLDWATEIVCISEFEKSVLTRDFAIPRSKVTVIPNGVSEIRSRTRAQIDFRHGEEVSLLNVGCIIEWKGIQHLLLVVKELMKRGVNVRLNIAGSGNYETTLRRESSSLGIADRVNWLGIVTGDRLNDLYRKADVFLLLSVGENFGTVVAEALAQGTPAIVTTTESALTEFTKEPGCFGVSYPPDEKEVADVVLRILESGTETGPFSRKIVGWEDVATLYEKTYEGLVRVGT
jgi:glycosyltransferase involved in cell wall biosynthesis